MSRMDVILNPLVFFPAEFYRQGVGEKPSESELLRHLCSINLPADIDAILERYEALMSEVDTEVQISPADKQILEKFVFPIKHAQNSHILGNYLGCIALCGTVSEMVAIMRFKITRMKIRDEPLSETAEKQLFGSTFERLGQERRVNILQAFGILADQEVKRAFDRIRTIRRKYLHFLTQGHDMIAEDATEAIACATRLLIWLMGPTIEDNNIRFDQAFTQYLIEQGVLQESDER